MLNIVICGTPGTGKSTLAEKLKPRLKDFHYVNLSKFAKDNDCIEQHDEELDTDVIAEPELVEKITPVLKANNLNIIESIFADYLPSKLVQWVFVCHADTKNVYDRLMARNYSELKIKNNVEAEIFRVVLESVIESFGQERVTEIDNNVEADLDKNAQLIIERVNHLLKLST